MNDKMAKIDKSRKSYKWYTRIDRKCVHWSLFNAYVLYKTESLQKDQKFIEFREFALQILNDLVGEGTFRRKVASQGEPSEVRFTREALHCPLYPADGTTDHRCVVCDKKHKLEKAQYPGKPYSQLVNKSVKTSVRCDTCDVYICIKKGSSCWSDYHTKVQ